MTETRRPAMRSIARTVLAALALPLILTACAGLPSGMVRPGKIVAAKGLTPQQRVERAVEFLNRGDEAHARVELVQALADQPAHAAARSLLGQIDVSPKTLLGEQSYAYVVKPGDTISGLADRLLGDRLMFYALAKYNGLKTPTDLAVGRVLRIPGVEKKIAPPQQPQPPPPPKRAAPQPAPQAPPPKPATDPARARTLRGQALRDMNSGAIDAAIALLRQALQLDPANGLIQKDLDRALRIQATVRARP